MLLGWVIGTLTSFSHVAVGLLLAFVGGGVLLNSIIEELPTERSSRFSAFVAGALGCVVALQLL